MLPTRPRLTRSITPRILILALAIVSSASPALAARCTDYSSCREAVEAWCAGRHNGADRDKDGIPCENVCPSREKVVEIMREIGCNR